MSILDLAWGQTDPVLRESPQTSVGSTAEDGLDFAALRAPVAGEVTPQLFMPDSNGISDKLILSILSGNCIYQGSLWSLDEEDAINAEFAARGQWLDGASSSAILALPSEDRSMIDYDHPRVAVGSYQQAVLRTGGAPNQVLRGIGGLYIGAAALSQEDLFEPRSSGLPAETRIRLNVAGVQSLEVLAQATRSITGLNGNHSHFPIFGSNPAYTYSSWIDARNTVYHEDDSWDVSPAVIKYLAGSNAAAYVDNFGDIGYGPGQNRIDEAIGRHCSVVSSVPSSYFSTSDNYAVAFACGISLYYIDSSKWGRRFGEGAYCGPYGTERVRPTIDDYVRIEVDHPTVPGDVTLNSSQGVFIADQDVTMAGGAPLQDARSVKAHVSTTTNPVIPPERFAGLVTRGNVVLGNAADKSPITKTKFVYINDVMRLEAHNTNPSLFFMGSSPGAELFLEESTGRIVLAYRTEEHGRLTKARLVLDPIGKKDIILADGSISQNPQDLVDSAARLNSPDPLEENLKLTCYTSYCDGVSSPEACPGGKLSRLTLKLNCEFSTDRFRFYWKRLGQGTDRWGETDWTELSVAQTADGCTAEAEVLDENDKPIFWMEADDGHPAYRDSIIQVMAIDIMNDQVAGASFYVDYGTEELLYWGTNGVDGPMEPATRALLGYEAASTIASAKRGNPETTSVADLLAFQAEE